MNFRQALLRAVLAAVAVMLVFAGPSFGVRGATPSHGALRDFARTTGPQRADARSAGCRARAPCEGDMEQLRDAADADEARRIPDEERGRSHGRRRRARLAREAPVIFRLDSARDLRLVADSKLTGGRGHAVTLQQSFEGLKVLNG